MSAVSVRGACLACTWAICLWSSPVRVHAQSSMSTAALSGTVRDQSDATVSGCAVTLTHTDTNLTWVSTTDDAGRFRFLALPTGPYTLAASRPGFTPMRETLTLTVGQALDVPVALPVAGVSERVVVDTTVPTLETTRTVVASTVRSTDIDALPVNGRNYLDLALIVPGVSRTNTGTNQRFAETSAVPGTGVSVSSQRNLNNNFIVDGLSANDDAAGLSGAFYSQEVVKEFQIVTSGAQPEFGRASAGVFNVVTRSGTNAVRGRAYGFFRDDALDARNALAQRRDPFRLSQVGGSVGGPIARDRSFFFGNAEVFSEDRTGFVTIAPDAAAAINQTLDRVAAPGARVSTGDVTAATDYLTLFARADQRVGVATQMALRYSRYDLESTNARTVGGLNDVSRGTGLDNVDQTFAWTTTSPLSSGTLFEARAQYVRSRLAAPINDPIGPAVNISGVASFGTATFSPTSRDIDLVEGVASLSHQRGRHLVKAGIDVLHNRVLIGFPGAVQGVYTFASLGLFQQGRYINFQQAFGEVFQRQSNPNAGLFVQDEWRPRSDLTLTGGLRYDLQDLPDPVEGDTNNLAPRIGVAYAPGDRRTVVRASVGWYYDRIPLRATSNALQRDGTKYRTAVLSFGQSPAPTFPAVLESYPPNVLPSVTTIDPDIQNGASLQASVQVDRDLGRDVVLSVGYERLRGWDIIMSRNVNVPTLTAAQAAALGVPNLGRPDPTIANNSRFGSLGDAWYDGMTVSVLRQIRGWGTARMSYTFSKAIDTAGNFFFSSPQDNANIRDEKGLSTNDQRHRFVLSGTASLPVGASDATWRRILGGWQLAGLFSYGSALPFNIQTGTDRNNDTNVNDRPAGVGRNTGRGFDAMTLDVRLSRGFPIGKRLRAEAIVEAFNVLNRANLQFPNNIFGPGVEPLPTFGQPTAAADPRQIQLGLRLDF